MINGVLRHTHSMEKAALGVGVHNALTACIGEQVGFDLLWLSSLEMSTAKFLPDVNIITPTEVASLLQEIRLSTALPIIVDADNGYGSDETAVRAAKAFCAAGANVVCIEDNLFPKRGSFYQDVDRQLERTADFAQRIAAVRRAVGDKMEIIARTEALVVGLDVAAAVERAQAYVAAGADAIFVQTNRATFDAFK